MAAESFPQQQEYPEPEKFPVTPTVSNIEDDDATQEGGNEEVERISREIKQIDTEIKAAEDLRQLRLAVNKLWNRDLKFTLSQLVVYDDPLVYIESRLKLRVTKDFNLIYADLLRVTRDHGIREAAERIILGRLTEEERKEYKNVRSKYAKSKKP